MAYIPLNKPMEEILVDMLNAANGTSYTVSMLDFGLPVANPGDDPEGTRNTKVTLTAVAGSGLAGTVDIWYNRLYAESFFEQASLDAGGDGVIRLHPDLVGSGITLHQAISLLETQYGISIDKTGIDATTVVQPVNDVLTFTMPSQSLMWVQTSFEVQVGVLGIPVEDIFPDQLEAFAELSPVMCSWLFVEDGAVSSGKTEAGRPTMSELAVPTTSVDVDVSTLPDPAESDSFMVTTTETKTMAPGMVFGFDLENEEVDARDENTYNIANAVQQIDSIFEVVSVAETDTGTDPRAVAVLLTRRFWRQTQNEPYDWGWGLAVRGGSGLLGNSDNQLLADVGIGTNPPQVLTARVEVKVLNNQDLHLFVKETVSNTVIYDDVVSVGDTTELQINHIARNWVEFV